MGKIPEIANGQNSRDNYKRWDKVLEFILSSEFSKAECRLC